MKLEVLWFQDTLVPSLEPKSSLCFLIYFASLEPINTSCQIQILRNPISARLIAHSFFRVWLNLGCSTKHFSMNMFPQSRMTRCGKQRSDVAFCRSLPRGEFLCEALHHWSATANEKMPLVMIFDLDERKLFWVQLKQGNLTDLMCNLTTAQIGLQYMCNELVKVEFLYVESKIFFSTGNSRN